MKPGTTFGSRINQQSPKQAPPQQSPKPSPPPAQTTNNNFNRPRQQSEPPKVHSSTINQSPRQAGQQPPSQHQSPAPKQAPPEKQAPKPSPPASAAFQKFQQQDKQQQPPQPSPSPTTTTTSSQRASPLQSHQQQSSPPPSKPAPKEAVVSQPPQQPQQPTLVPYSLTYLFRASFKSPEQDGCLVSGPAAFFRPLDKLRDCLGGAFGNYTYEYDASALTLMDYRNYQKTDIKGTGSNVGQWTSPNILSPAKDQFLMNESLNGDPSVDGFWLENEIIVMERAFEKIWHTYNVWQKMEQVVEN